MNSAGRKDEAGTKLSLLSPPASPGRLGPNSDSASRNCLTSPGQLPALTTTPGLVLLGGRAGPSEVPLCAVPISQFQGRRATSPPCHLQGGNTGLGTWVGNSPPGPSLTQCPQAGGANRVISQAHPRLQGVDRALGGRVLEDGLQWFPHGSDHCPGQSAERRWDHHHCPGGLTEVLCGHHSKAEKSPW